MRILSVLHPSGGHSGLLAQRARAAGHELLEWCPGDGQDVPGALTEFDALAVFGGAQNVHEVARLPWMTREIELLREALATGMPTIGVCLGAQLLTTAAGGRVYRVDEPEIGWFGVDRLPAGADDPVVGALPARFTAYQWHSYACEPPAGAVELAVSPVCRQAFRIGERAWGVQFHPEVDEAIVEAWSRDLGNDPDAVALGVEAEAVLAAARRELPAWKAIGTAIFDGFLAAAIRVPG